MDSFGGSSHYQVYVLRLWWERAESPERPPITWRFVLEEPRTGQRRGFASFGALMDFLAGELDKQERG